ncbi:MAG: hypothetical protein HEQ38_05260 [Gemmatimonas sp.]|nr:hypothetical protein [Gemmatimonas sp.]
MMKSVLRGLAVFTLLLTGALACRHPPAAPPRPEMQRRTERLVVEFIQTWRREMAAATVPGSPRLPPLASTGYCPYWGLERQRSHTLVQQVELEMPSASAAKVRALRLALLDSLRAVLIAEPLDSVTLGQLTRFAIDASRMELALPVVRSCAATRVFCLELEARLVYADGRLAAADSLFSAVRAFRRTVCDAGVSYLLAEFESVFDPCDAAALSPPQQERLWWAADPLWSTPYNERRIEHERRRLDHAMRLQVGRDEFLD